MSWSVDPRMQRETGRSLSLVPTPAPVVVPDLEPAPGPTWHRRALALPAGAEPLVVRSRWQKLMHRAYRTAEGRLAGHARCHVSERSVVVGSEIPDGTPPAQLCRYPWCFRDDVVAAGMDPVTGHAHRPRGRATR